MEWMKLIEQEFPRIQTQDQRYMKALVKCFGIEKWEKLELRIAFPTTNYFKDPSWIIFSNKEGLPQSFWLLDINHIQSLPQFQESVCICIYIKHVDHTYPSFITPGHRLQASSIDQNRRRACLTNLSLFSFGLWLSSHIQNQVD